MVNTFVMFLSRVIGHLVDKLVFKTERGHGPAFWITMIIAELVLGILASIIVMWFRASASFRPTRVVRTWPGAAPWLRRWSAWPRCIRKPLPDKMAAFGIAGGGAGGLKRLFMTHPPLEAHRGPESGRRGLRPWRRQHRE